MNFSTYINQSNGTNLAFDSIEDILHTYFIFEIHAIALFINTPIAAIGFILNAFSLWVLTKREFYAMPIFEYMRVYSLNSLVADFSGFFLWCGYARFFSITNSIMLITFYFRFVSPISNATYIHGSLLDISMLLSRIGTIERKLNWFNTLRPRLVCLFAFVTSMIINFPWFYRNQLKMTTFNVRNKNGSVETFILYDFESNEFKDSKTGIILTLVGTILRDYVVFCMEVFLNLLGFVLLKKYMKRHRQITGQDNIINATALTVYISVKPTNTLNFQRNFVQPCESASTSPASQNENRRSNELAETKAFRMIFVMCLLSLMQHVITSLCTLISNNKYLSLICNITFTLKPAFNFWVFLRFNSVFREMVNKSLFRKT